MTTIPESPFGAAGGDAYETGFFAVDSVTTDREIVATACSPKAAVLRTCGRSSRSERSACLFVIAFLNVCTAGGVYAVVSLTATTGISPLIRHPTTDPQI